MTQERILAIHDISCVGRCSLTVALPIISATGIECSVLPTAVLSTHTGGFTGFTYRDLTEDMIPVDEHWGTLGLKFGAVYTGFLGSFEQIDIVKRIIDDVSDEGTTVYVDPVMADKGKLYTIFGPDFPAGMRKLCEKADVIIPNLTELAFMMGTEYVEGPYTREYISQVLEDARCFGTKRIVITGVSYEAGTIGAVYMDYETGETGEYMTSEIPGYFHGTGDVFGSAFVGAAESGVPLGEAVRIAVRYTYGSIERTVRDGTDIRYGVNFEEGIRDYIADIDAALRAPVFLAVTSPMGLAGLSWLASTLWHQAYDDLLPEGQVDYMLGKYQSLQALMEQLSQGYVHLVAVSQGRQVGYVSYVHREDGTFLSKLYVDENHRRTGIARRAVAALVSEARAHGSRRVHLTVNKDNRGAIDAYTRLGFRECGRGVTDIGSGYVMDDIYMELIL